MYYNLIDLKFRTWICIELSSTTSIDNKGTAPILNKSAFFSSQSKTQNIILMLWIRSVRNEHTQEYGAANYHILFFGLTYLTMSTEEVLVSNNPT